MEQIFGKYLGGIVLIVAGVASLAYTPTLVGLSVLQTIYLLPLLLASTASPILGLWLLGSKTWIFEKGR